ncbi:hypothetical protein LSH36_661g01021 [Paralvinella palmiformis]|uniref:Uncharacterized protein n=1 Tax=Paralvinella palmiformis TaxID=53620 RepID=A0AAD9MVJ8_9ANNE|nr:hypothetical protein LSH36_661g01021 [Paralvinella palmiformis]
MVKALLLFTSLALILASSYAMKCYSGANIGSVLKATIKDGCGSCLSLNILVHTFMCSPVSCSLSTKLTKVGFKCCMDKDLCNSAAGDAFPPPGQQGMAVGSTLVIIASHRKIGTDLQRPDKNIKPRNQACSECS